MLSINDSSDKSTNKVVKDIDKKSNLHSDMIEGHSNLKRRYSVKSKNKEVMKLHSDIINKDFDENVQKLASLKKFRIAYQYYVTKIIARHNSFLKSLNIAFKMFNGIFIRIFFDNDRRMSLIFYKFFWIKVLISPYYLIHQIVSIVGSGTYFLCP